MKRVLYLSKRNVLETVKDYVSLIFILGFPIVMLVLMQAIFGSMENAPSFIKIEQFASGICVFGYSFVMLYVAINITVDKSSAFMTRILVSPVKNIEYLLSYIFSALFLSFIQTVIFYIISLFFGLSFGGRWFLSILTLIPAMLFFAVAGVFIGVVAKNDKQSGPISSIFISGSGMLGGVWMPIETMGTGFFTVCKILPFYNAVVLGKDAFTGLSIETFYSFLIVLGWTAVLLFLCKLIFDKTIKG